MLFSSRPNQYNVMFLVQINTMLCPPNIERLLNDDDYYITENLMALRNTRIGNLMGVCALTLPTGIPSCGVMLMGHPVQEERLLRLGLAAEAALG